MKLLEGKTAIITGASRGIGRGIAEVFAAHGANIAFSYSSSAKAAKELEEKLSAQGVKVKGYQSDASNFAQSQEFVDAVVAEFGTVDILVNNAGITKDNLLMLFNMVRSEKEAVRIFEHVRKVARANIENPLNLEFLGAISEDKNVSKSIKQRTLFTDDSEFCLPSLELNQIAQKLISRLEQKVLNPSTTNSFSGFFRRLMEQF